MDIINFPLDDKGNLLCCDVSQTQSSSLEFP